MDLVEDDGNNDLVEFYRNNITFFKQVLLCQIKLIILENMAILLHSTIRGFEWQEYVEDMGIKDYFEIIKIDSKSKLWQEEPIFTALRCALRQNRSFGDIINVLLKRQRLDVLRYVKSYAESLLTTSSGNHTSSINQNSHSGCFDILSSTPCSSSLDVCFKFEENDLKESKLLAENQSENDALRSKLPISKSLVVKLPEKSNGETEQNPKKEDILLSMPPPYNDECITVFITYAEMDLAIAQELSNKLQAESFIVRLYSEMDYLSFTDPAGNIRAILWEIDFIVPIVSKTYIEQIHSRQDSTFVDSSSEIDNRYIYQLLQNEYRMNRCLNFRVRPVILPNVDRRLLMYDMLLSYSMRLWHEVPKLIKVLRKTKERLPRFN